MMRTAILCLAMLAVAHESAAQKDLEKERVTLSFNKVPIEDVIRPLAGSLGYDFIIEPSLRPVVVTIQVENVTARTALTAICESVGTGWRKGGSRVLVIGEVASVSGTLNEKGRARLEQMRKSGRLGGLSIVASLDEQLPDDITWFYMPLRDAASMLGRAFRATADVPANLATRKVTTSIKSQTLRQALDAMCAAADCQWEIEELPPVHNPPAPPYPSRVIHVRDRVYDEGAPGVIPPAAVSETKPAYTAEAMRQKLQGRITLSAVVLPDGSVGDVAIVDSLDKQYGLDDEAVKALRQWRFRPGSKDGRSVAVRTRVELTFSLR
ncbi:MAG: energy transducer TonB [Bacteroidales bacterium]